MTTEVKGALKKINSPTMIKCPVCTSSHLPRKEDLTNGVYASNCVNCGHFFKFRAIQDLKSTATFTINGTQYTAGNEFNPATSLAEYMRYTGVSVGTKGCCYEGGCGVCIVSVKLYNPITKTNVDCAVNSCCLQLFTCDGLEITTIEGLGNPKKGLHVIQERLVQHDGSQCGFCSPGQVMHMYGLLKSNPSLTVQDIEDDFDATLCRCTGYRSILDAMKTFATDAPKNLKGRVVDIEEIDAKLCKKTGQSCNGKCPQNGTNNHSCGINRSLHIVGATTQWLKPVTLTQLTQYLNQYRNNNYRLVFGNTSFGPFAETGPWNFEILIDIRSIQELYTVNFGSSSVVLGANLSITNLKDIFASKINDSSIPYAAAFVQHLKKIGHHGIRNMCSWAGNMALKNAHNEFASDVFVIFETVSPTISLLDGDGTQKTYSFMDFLSVNLKGKAIISMTLPTYKSTNIRVRTYRNSLRFQACKSYVNAGFNFEADANNNFLVLSKPSIIIQGISSKIHHATQTEAYLTNKSLGDPNVLKGALTTLSNELVTESRSSWASPEFRKSLALSLFYKCVLDICSSKASSRYVSGGPLLVRTPIVGTQDYGTDKTRWPITEPVQTINAPYLASGMALYLDDVPRAPNELFGAVVISTQGNATIDKIDASVALTLPGVVAFIKASDIPAGGANNWRPASLFGGLKEELLSSGTINYAGQPIGIIVANTETMAQTGAAMVNVTYKNIKTPVVDIQTAIQNKAFFPNPPYSLSVGNAQAAIASAPHKINGNISIGGQYHFYLEKQTSICTPTDVGGMYVKASTQWIDGVLETVAQVLGLNESKVTVEVERLGGGFGGKITQNFLVSGLCALAAYVVGRPVKLHLDIHTNMKMLGKRTNYYAEYQVGSDNNGKLAGIIINIYGDVGWALTPGESPLYSTEWFDNAYFCENWTFTPIPVKTNTAINTACRSPGSTPYMFVIESIMEHLAKSLNLDQLDVRQLNLYTKGQLTPTKQPLIYCNIREVVSKLITDIGLDSRKAAVEAFNKANRWKKRGISVMPNRFGISYSWATYNTHVIIHHGDGSVAIAHGGIDMGQGINTKVIQVCAAQFNIPIDQISVKTSSTTINANSSTTGGSVTAELCCKGVIEACTVLNARMAPVKAKMVNPTWIELVSSCYDQMIDLTASYSTHEHDPYTATYSCYSAVCVEAELDVLTGQYQLRQMDMLYDCGESINPELDIGQAEGGFVMGLGLFLQEELKYDPQTGQLSTASTWDYKIPLPKDLPMNFNFKFLRNAPNPLGVLGAKAIGEPPLVMAAAAVFAIKHAIEAARAEISQDTFFPLNAPATLEKVHSLCLNNIANFTYGN